MTGEFHGNSGRISSNGDVTGAFVQFVYFFSPPEFNDVVAKLCSASAAVITSLIPWVAPVSLATLCQLSASNLNFAYFLFFHSTAALHFSISQHSMLNIVTGVVLFQSNGLNLKHCP